MKKEEKYIWKCLDSLLYCICILGRQANNYSQELNTAISDAGLAVKRIREYFDKKNG